MDVAKLIEQAKSEASWLDDFIGEEPPAGDLLRELTTALETLQRERDEAREALRPFAADKLPTTKKTVRDFDEHGLRRMMSPMEIARMRARAALSPKEAEE